DCGWVALELAFRLQHVATRRDAAIVAVIREIERFLKGDGSFVEQLLLRVQRSHLKIVWGELAACAERGRFQVGVTGLSGRFAGFDRAANSSPDIQLPRYID